MALLHKISPVSVFILVRGILGIVLYEHWELNSLFLFFQLQGIFYLTAQEQNQRTAKWQISGAFSLHSCPPLILFQRFYHSASGTLEFLVFILVILLFSDQIFPSLATDQKVPPDRNLNWGAHFISLHSLMDHSPAFPVTRSENSCFICCPFFFFFLTKSNC